MSCKYMNRREFLRNTAIGGAAISLGISREENALQAAQTKDIHATVPEFEVPTGKIGDITMSRLICGGNLIGGYAHSRDLVYVSELLRNYFTAEKIIETLHICEQRGINTLIANIRKNPNDAAAINVLNKYWNERGGTIQWIAQCNPRSDDVRSNIDLAIDNGAIGAFVQGGIGDLWTKNQRVDLLGETVEYIKSRGLIAGVAGHSLQVPMECEKQGVDVDFYVKTFHHDDYWSATPEQYREDFIVDQGRSDDHNKDHDNIWCINPEDTKKFMSQVKKPWIAYKVMAAGAIHPREAFEFAYKNGADFIVAGMFDFQIIEDSILARNAVQNNQERQRPWYG
ncbi:MAG: hypothetical protein GF372_00290 [Candidatus Marinimicrobia bacterium]|nr:hypothetical protein [Candidatus Neomarinimicrobiota bacterium]